MKILFTIFFSILLFLQGYSQNLKQRILDEGFLLEEFGNAEILQIKEVKRINRFEDEFWKNDSLSKDFKFIIPFNFKIGKISKDSQYGIPVEGLPVGCFVFDCRMSWVKLLLYSKKDYELFMDEGGLSSTIKANILNEASLPYFAESPELAYTEIKFPKRIKIKKSEYILSKITEIYFDIIENRISEENLSIQEALKKYPLLIMLTKFYPAPKMPEGNKRAKRIDKNQLIQLNL